MTFRSTGKSVQGKRKPGRPKKSHGGNLPNQVEQDGEISTDELVTVLSMMCDGMDEKELKKIAEKFIEEIDNF